MSVGDLEDARAGDLGREKSRFRDPRSGRLLKLLEDALGDDLPVAIRAWDGHAIGATDADAVIVLRSPAALERIVAAPGELGFARAHVAGDLDVEGDIFALFDLRDRMPHVGLTPAQRLRAAQIVGAGVLRRHLRPPEEIRLHGRRRTRRRDATAVSSHYDVSNRFYELVLGATMTYSCAVFHDIDVELADAQAAKHELVCRKLGLRPGMRLLDVGCGWGEMLLHAARHHGVHGVGVTVSHQQAVRARERIAEAGLADRLEVREQDYRDVADGPYDAISSIGMFEHVGAAMMRTYFDQAMRLLASGGRFLNHAIGRPAGAPPGLGPDTFIGRYVFPDGELHEVGKVVAAIQHAGFEVRHLEGLREHYGLTLRHWVANLEASWDAAVAEVGVGRARVWRLYMAGSAVNFEAGRLQVHQVLGVKPHGGASGLALRPGFDV